MLAVRLDVLQAFVVLAEEGQFTRAAARLHIGQSGLSRQIATLERALGQSLIERASPRLELTRAGVAFLPHVREVLESASRALTAMTTQTRR